MANQTVVVSDSTARSNRAAVAADALVDGSGVAILSGTSPALASPTATTQTANDNSTKLATTAYVDRASGGGIFTAAAPAGTVSATAVMMAAGAASITLARGTKFAAMVSFQAANSLLNDGITCDFRFGTGVAPVNGAAVTGTLMGISQTRTSLVAGDRAGMTLLGRPTGLVVGTTYWVDVSVLAITAGTASITGVTIRLNEVE